MIAKMSSSNTLYSALAYNQNKVDDAHATVIFANKMIESADGNYDINSCLRSFEPYLLANQRTEKPVLHVSINPDPKDVLTNEQLSEIAQEWMQKMGYGDQPFIVYLHEDIERRHIHIVSLRVDENGRKIDDRFEHRRSMDACRELEQRYGLVPADIRKHNEGLPLKPVNYKDGDVKRQIANVIRQVAKEYHFLSLKEYKALLTLYNTGMEEVRGEINGKPYRGLVYSALNKKGEKVGNPFKSSLFGRSVGVEALEKRIVKSAEIIKNKGLKERSKKVISAAMQTCKTRKDFEKALEKQGISVLFRTNDDGRIYGVTFIDHEQKCVFNGSRLGKDFSANVFNEMFKNDNITELESSQSFNQKNHSSDTRKSFNHENHSSDIGGIFDLLSPEISGENHEEEAFIRRMKKKKRKQKRI